MCFFYTPFSIIISVRSFYIIAMFFDVFEALFTIISAYEKKFSDKKNITILSISFVLYEKYMTPQTKGTLFLVHLLKFESHTATSKNKQ